VASIGFPPGPGRDAHLSFTVPGAVDAYLTLLETYGTRSCARRSRPPSSTPSAVPDVRVHAPDAGDPETRSQFDLYPPGGDAVFYPERRPPRVGELFVQPALAGTLKRLVEADTKPAAIACAASRARASGSIAATSRR
jgi:gamma-glutamyltranspeptidase